MKKRFPCIGFEDSGRSEPLPASRFPGSDRSAIIVTALFVLTVLSVPKLDLASVLAFAAFPVFLISAARVPAEIIGKPLLRLSPFILIMAAGNIALDRTPIFFFSGLTITGGMISGTVIVAKTMITVAAMLSITLCIPFYRICRALEALHLPEVLVTQLMLLYRYRSVLHEEASTMQKARDIRSFGNKGKGLFRTASLLGSLLLRTTNRAERLFRSMSARGFQSRVFRRTPAKMTSREWRSIALWSLFFLTFRLIF